MTGQELGAVVLSGGGGSRLGGADKATIEIAGRSLLERALQALVDVPDVVVVGPEAPTSRPVSFTREDPPGGGPAAGLLAGVRRFARTPAWVLVLAVDMPLVTPATVRRLTVAARADGAVLVDDRGRVQHLCAVYSVAALGPAASGAGHPSGHALAMRDLVAGLELEHVAAEGEETRDVDSWQDLADLRRALGE